MTQYLDKYFEVLAQPLHQFARDNGLLLSKYLQEEQAWFLCFTHPLGGQARVDINRGDETAVYLRGVWYLDEFPKFTRHVRQTQIISVDRKAELVTRAVADVFDQVMSWTLGKWDSSSAIYQELWSGLTQEQFSAMAPNWPKPKRPPHKPPQMPVDDE